MYTTLIEAAELGTLLGEPQCAVFDCRFDLARPNWGLSAYQESHIPQALYACLERDLSGPVGPTTGRHPLPDPERFAAALGTWGIDEDVQVVAYDQGNGAFAARLWWLLRWAGHRGVAVLNGGFRGWLAAALPVASAVSERSPRRFVPDAPAAGTVSASELELALNDAAVLLVDARSADRFAGENETLDPVAGHIPGARNLPFGGNLDSQGRFLEAVELQRRWRTLLAGRPPAQLVAMCGSGVTACHNLLALEIAGLPGGRLYPGSWSEWIREPRRARAPRGSL